MAGIAFAQPGYRRDPGVGDILGQGQYQSDAHKIFRMVRYDPPTWSGSGTLAADSIVIWSLDDDYGDDGVTVTTTTTSYDSAVAGIIVQQAQTPDADDRTAVEDIGHRNWTWLQTYGLSEATVQSPVNSGDSIATSSTAGSITQFFPSTSDSGANGNAGFAYDAATTSATDVQVFIMLD